MLNQAFWDYYEVNRKLLEEGRYEEALNSSHIIYGISRSHNNLRLIHDSTCNLGEIYSNINEPEKALDYFKEEVALIKEFGATDEDDNIALGVMYERIGFEYQYELKEYESALSYYEKAIKHYKLGYMNKGVGVEGLDSIHTHISKLEISLQNENKLIELSENRTVKSTCFTMVNPGKKKKE